MGDFIRSCLSFAKVEGMKYKLKCFEIVRHGIEYPDYFEGCGVSLTPYDFVLTETGDSEVAAILNLEDALLDQFRWAEEPHLTKQVLTVLYPDILDTGTIDDYLKANPAHDNGVDIPQWYVSIRFCLEEVPCKLCSHLEND